MRILCSISRVFDRSIVYQKDRSALALTASENVIDFIRTSWNEITRRHHSIIQTSLVTARRTTWCTDIFRQTKEHDSSGVLLKSQHVVLCVRVPSNPTPLSVCLVCFIVSIRFILTLQLSSWRSTYCDQRDKQSASTDHTRRAFSSTDVPRRVHQSHSPELSECHSVKELLYKRNQPKVCETAKYVYVPHEAGKAGTYCVVLSRWKTSAKALSSKLEITFGKLNINQTCEKFAHSAHATDSSLCLEEASENTD
jgi:hypothetical protein